MKRMKWMLGVAALTLALSGCGGTGGTPTAEGSTNSSTSSGTGSSATEQSGASQTDVEQVTLRFAWWGGDSRHTATLEAIAAYEKQNPNVKIEAEYQGYDGYND